MNPLVMALLSKWLGKGGGANPYFTDPGSAPYNDSTFSADEQLPMQPNNIWQQLGGDNMANRVNADYMSTLARQPILKDMARFSSDLGLESKKKGIDMERDAALEKEKLQMEQMGKTVFDSLSDRFDLPLDFSGTNEDIGRRFKFQYPNVEQQGLTTFSRSGADIAKNQADQLTAENQMLEGRARQPSIAPIARNVAERAQTESTLSRDFLNSPEGRRLFNIKLARDVVPIHGAGFDDAFGTVYNPGHPTENVRMIEYGKDSKGNPIIFPQTTRGYEGMSVSPYRDSVGRIDRPNPTPPGRGINPEQDYGGAAGAPAEVSVPSRNQDTTFGEAYGSQTPDESFIQKLRLLQQLRNMPITDEEILRKLQGIR